MKVAVGIFLVIFLTLQRGSHGMFTPLEIDNHPCQPENLKRAISYICTTSGDIVCQNGWREPSDPDKKNPLNPCPEPICSHEGGCLHGVCRSPDSCACEVGWEGINCETCIPLPGCKHGHCNQELECLCESGWGGGYCDIPECEGCSNGYCAAPNECMCFDGWSGLNCSECIPMAGCVHGKCTDRPQTCDCDAGWEGTLCDSPICNPACEHGQCVINEEEVNYCICETGWTNPGCDQCKPYWECPNQEADACLLPNECHCASNEVDPKGLCYNDHLTKSQIISKLGPKLIQPATQPQNPATENSLPSDSGTEEITARNQPLTALEL